MTMSPVGRNHFKVGAGLPLAEHNKRFPKMEICASGEPVNNKLMKTFQSGFQ